MFLSRPKALQAVAAPFELPDISTNSTSIVSMDLRQVAFEGIHIQVDPHVGKARDDPKTFSLECIHAWVRWIYVRKEAQARTAAKCLFSASSNKGCRIFQPAQQVGLVVGFEGHPDAESPWSRRKDRRQRRNDLPQP